MIDPMISRSTSGLAIAFARRKEDTFALDLACDKYALLLYAN
jgi:hypothetical protein